MTASQKKPGGARDRRTALRACVSLAVLLVATGCSTPPQARIPAAPMTLRVVDPTFDVGSDARVPALPDATTLDPLMGGTVDSRELFRCCLARTLLSWRVDPGSGPNGTALRPDLASGLPSVSADGLTWTFNLRSGLHYAPPLQNTEIVAGDLVRAMVRTARLGKPPPPAYSVIRGFDEFATGKTTAISGVETPDAHTLVVRLQTPTGDLADRLSLGYAAPIPPRPGDPSAPLGVLTGHDDGAGGFLVSSGPYMLEGSEALDFTVPPAKQRPASGLHPGSSLTLVRNPSWSSSDDALRPALPDRIEIVYTRTATAAAQLIDSGRADLVLSSGIPPQAPLDQIRAYQADRSRGRVDIQSGDQVRYLSMNLAVPPFDDIHVRRAVAWAIDRADVVAAVGGPITGTLTGHLIPDSLEDDALLNFDPYRAATADQRLARARAEMAQSRYDGLHTGACATADCRHILALGRVDKRLPAAYDVIKRDLERVGIDIEVRLEPFGTFFDHIGDPATRTPMALMWGWGKDYDNASSFFTPLFSRAGLAEHGDFSLVGAGADELRGWGYPVSGVPSIDARIAQCVPLVGGVQTRCWTALDQYVTEDVVPAVAMLSEPYVEVVPRRVTYAFDRVLNQPALDAISVTR